MRRWLGLAFLLMPATLAFSACSTLSVTTPVFGTYTGASAVTTTSVLTVNCTAGYAYILGVGTSYYSGSTSPRYMATSPAVTSMTYGMYKDAAHTMNWGVNSGVDTVSGVGTGSNQTYTIYGLIPALQNLAPGNYTDYPIVYIQGGAFVNFYPTATVPPSCTIAAANLSFGTYTGSVLDTTANLTVNCTDTTTYNLGLNAGTSTGATVTARAMTGPSSSTLPYNLYTTSAHTSNWGNTVGTDTVAGTGTGTAQTVTIYGEIAAGDYPKPGSYSDTLTVTLTY